MLNKIKPKTEFGRSVLTLITGTTIAQAIPIAISPILTRMYSPEEFGTLALFVAIISILGVVVTGRYEHAIILPKKDEDALRLVGLSIVIAVCVSIICLIIIVIFNSRITELLSNSKISFWLYSIPLVLVLTGVYQSFNYWINRKKQYKIIAINRVIQSGTTATGNLTMGYSGFGSNGLIAGQIVGQIIATVWIAKFIWNSDGLKLLFASKIKFFAIAKRYDKFPKYDLLAALANVSSHQITHVFFNILFGAVTAGYFYLMQKILNLPVLFVSTSIADVFRQSATNEYHQLKNCKKIFLSTFKKLLFLSILPCVVLYLYSVELFTFIFGEEWRIAGKYAKVFVPMLFLQFISSPLSVIFYITEKQHVNLLLQMLLLIMVVLSLWLANDGYQATIFLSFSMSLYYIVQLTFSAFYAKVFTVSALDR